MKIKHLFLLLTASLSLSAQNYTQSINYGVSTTTSQFNSDVVVYYPVSTTVTGNTVLTTPGIYYYYVNTTSSAMIALPTLTGFSVALDREFFIKNIGTGTVTISVTGPVLIEGLVSYLLPYKGAWVKVKSDAFGWQVIDRSATPDLVQSATDADYTVTSSFQLVKLPVITAARNLNLPSAANFTGQQIKIWNQNTSGTFMWNFATTVKDASNNTITTVVNSSWYTLESDGTNWLKQN